MTSTALIILNYNNWEDTVNCIESVEEHNTAPIKYIVVDNGSNRYEAVEKLEKYFQSKFNGPYCRIKDEDKLQKTVLPRLTFLVSKTNDGYAQGNNKGLRLAFMDKEIEFVMVLNNDILFVEDIIPDLIRHQQTITDCAIISPVLYKKGLKSLDYNCARKNHTEWEIILTYLFLYKDFFGYISKHVNKRLLLKHNPSLMSLQYFEIELPSGSCMLIKKALVQEIGGFDPNTFLYFEENILYKKIQGLGMKNYLVPSLRCIHLGASSTSKSSSSFIAKKGLHSVEYYLKTYCRLSKTQSILLSLAHFLFMVKIELIKVFRENNVKKK